MFNFNPFKDPIGLDISDFRIRFFQLDGKRKNKVKVQSFGEIEVPAGYISDGEIKGPEEVSELIKTLINQPIFGKVKNVYINASLLEKKIFIKTIQIPNVPEEEMKGAVAWGVEQNIPISTEQAYFDWQKIEQPSDKVAKNKQKKVKEKRPEKVTVLAAVAPKPLVDNYTAVIKQAGLIPIGFENESIAITRCLIDQSSRLTNPLIILDMGLSQTTLVIYHQNTIFFTSAIGVSGAEMTAQIAKYLKLEEREAEKAKIICGLDKRKGKGAIRKVLEPIIKRLVNKIKESTDYYYNYLGDNKKINSLILTGGMSQMIGLAEYLQKNLKCNIIYGDPKTNINIFKTKDERISRINLTPLSTAIGLALKKFD